MFKSFFDESQLYDFGKKADWFYRLIRFSYVIQQLTGLETQIQQKQLPCLLNKRAWEVNFNEI